MNNPIETPEPADLLRVGDPTLEELSGESGAFNFGPRVREVQPNPQAKDGRFKPQIQVDPVL